VVTKERTRTDYQEGVDAALVRLRQAYDASLTDKSQTAIDALEKARADLRKLADESPLESNANFTTSKNSA
jgi:hypothetical protein